MCEGDGERSSLLGWGAGEPCASPHHQTGGPRALSGNPHTPCHPLPCPASLADNIYITNLEDQNTVAFVEELQVRLGECAGPASSTQRRLLERPCSAQAPPWPARVGCSGGVAAPWGLLRTGARHPNRRAASTPLPCSGGCARRPARRRRRPPAPLACSCPRARPAWAWAAAALPTWRGRCRAACPSQPSRPRTRSCRLSCGRWKSRWTRCVHAVHAVHVVHARCGQRCRRCCCIMLLLLHTAAAALADGPMAGNVIQPRCGPRCRSAPPQISAGLCC